MKKRNVFIIILLLTSLGAAYFIGRNSVKEVEPEIIEIDLTDSQILQVQQEARLNWIPLDSAMTWLEGLETVDSIRWHDSTKILWNIKDSIRIIDSVRVVYTPFFEGDDTLIHFDEMVENTRIELSLAIKPRFFPFQSRFITDVQMKSLKLTRPVQVESWWAHRWTVYLGYGIMYYRSTTQTNNTFLDDDYDDNRFTTSTKAEWRFDHGIQLGIGFRIF